MKEKRKFVILECVTTFSHAAIKQFFHKQTFFIPSVATKGVKSLYVKQVDVNEAQDLTGKK